MAYTTINKSTDYFNTKLYTGTGSSNAITGVGFQPDWTWIKNRSETYSHQLYDAVRGVTKRIFSDLTTAEETDANGLTAFGTDGFTVGSNVGVNKSSNNIVAWNWKANGAGSANTDGSQNTTVSVNTTAGFSIVKWTGADSTASLGHGLGAVPKMIIVKRLASRAWTVYHANVGANKKLVLNTTAGEASSSDFDDTPTSSVINVGYTDDVNGSGADYIAYCFAEKKGYSKIGSYTGNSNADGTFVYTGFKPAFLLLKKYTASGQQWYIYDSKRDGKNQGDGASGGNRSLRPNTTSAEEQASGYPMDILSNGFKWRGSSTEQNSSGQSYIYMAFAEEPLVANVGASIPATAR